jgi:hypothetical protein
MLLKREGFSLNKFSKLIATIAAFLSLSVVAQEPIGQVIVNGTLDPPEIVYSNVAVAITDNGNGNYILDFEEDISGVSGSAFTKGPGFEAPLTVPNFVIDSGNPSRLNVLIRP